MTEKGEEGRFSSTYSINVNAKRNQTGMMSVGTLFRIKGGRKP
jgi:hypothetical protein